jgi:lipopolysaccharide transport system ATP-binding protein
MKMSNDIAIRVENVSKYYRLGVINNGTLFRDIQSWMARKRGKEDPHAKIGSKYDPTLEGFWALKDLNFEIKKGDRVGIIGHNGAGKSTLLKILSGITTPTEGNIKINGRISSLLEVGTGFHPEMTGRENVYLNGAILGMKKSEINKKIDEIIEFSGIKEHIDTPVKRYSSGMYVRLAFAVAAHLDSDILIADEVLAVGDAAFQKKALGKMNELSSGEGRTVLFVSHNMAQVKNLCNKGICIEKGIIKEYYNNINDAISWYLGEFSSEKYPITKWNNNNKFYNALFTPLEIKIVNNNGEVFEEPINYNEDFIIYIKFKVDFTGNMDFFFRINRSIDVLCNYYTNEVFAPGVYEKTFNVPKRTFLPGSYTLTLGASDLKEKSWIIDESRRDISIFFKIFE